MTKPRQDRAGRYMIKAMKNFSEASPPAESINTFLQCSTLADQDFSECRTDQQKQKVWSVLVSAASMVIRNHDSEGIAISALRDALTNTSLGRAGNHGLKSPTIPNTQPFDSEWAKACVIALLEAHPNLHKKTKQDARGYLDINEEGLAKMHENFKGNLIGGNTLAQLVKTANKLINEFGYDSLKELIYQPPKPRRRT
jgi:hypothetical protein